ncbi:unnamed protein product [Cuscuta campestris]|uniref:Uncharacterized protein n=1 Tax=Cuscuta campestris TaxID=132261 RepID=A0A484KUV8_9ASTE|nr:unnamed protein product [Cuscuta campestris]
MSERRAPPTLLKHKSWSPDMYREETWARRKGNNRRRGRTKSVTNDDLDELRGCIDLGFVFDPDSTDLDPNLAKTFPALDLFCAVNRCLSRSSSTSTLASDSDTAAFSGSPSPSPVIDLGEDPATVKSRLKQWAQVVACSVRQSAPIH